MANGDVELSANGIVSAICGGGTLADRMVWQGAASLGCVEDQWHGGGGNGGAHWVGQRFISGTLRKLHEPILSIAQRSSHYREDLTLLGA